MIPWWAALVGIAVAVGVAQWLGAAYRMQAKRERTESLARALHNAAGPLTPWERLPVARRQRLWNVAADLLHGL